MKGLARRSPVYYGWVILLLGIVSSLFVVAVLFWAIAIYIPAIAEDFNVGGDAQRFPVVAAFMSGQLLSALMAPIAGRWMDARGARETILVGTAAAAAALLATSQATELWHVYIGWGAVSMARALLFPISYNWLVTRWFAARRQMALGVLTIGFGLGGVAVLPLSAIEERWDWSTVMIVSAGLMLAVNGLLALLLVFDRPADLGLQVEGAAPGDGTTALAETVGFTVGEAVRTPAFWLLGLGFMVFFVAPYSVSTLQLDFFETRGVQNAALIVAIAALVRGSSRLPLGLLLGRIQRVFLLAFVVALTQASAVLIVVSTTSTAGIVGFVLLWGLGGAFVPMMEPVLISRAFGVRHFGTISGAITMIAFPGTALGPILAGALFDRTGSYTLPFSLLAVTLLVSAGLLVLAGMAVNGAAHRQASARRGLEPVAAATAAVAEEGAREVAP